MTDKQILKALSDAIKDDIKADQRAKNIRASGRSADSLREEITDNDLEAVMNVFGTFYFEFQKRGRRPGKNPPISPILQWIDDKNITPDGISKKSLAFLIAKKIGDKGTDIHMGKRPGLDIKTILERNLINSTRQLAKEKSITYASDFTKLFNED